MIKVGLFRDFGNFSDRLHTFLDIGVTFLSTTPSKSALISRKVKSARRKELGESGKYQGLEKV